MITTLVLEGYTQAELADALTVARRNLARFRTALAEMVGHDHEGDEDLINRVGKLIPGAHDGW
jgi:hypothetical protein